MDARPLSEKVASFRRAYRREHVGPRYSGRAHFAFTTLGSLAIIAFALSRLERVRPVEWCVVPAVWVLGNVVEFLGHRGPMHHRRRGLELLFLRHSQHHRFFTHESMAYESHRDVKMVLFPPVLLLFFLGAIAAPLGWACFALTTANAGWLFVAAAVGYYLAYEWLHFCHHLPPEHPVARLAFMAKLRAHHQAHHDPRRMRHCNFNVSFPLADWLFGTTWRPDASAARPVERR